MVHKLIYSLAVRGCICDNDHVTVGRNYDLMIAARALNTPSLRLARVGIGIVEAVQYRGEIHVTEVR